MTFAMEYIDIGPYMCIAWRMSYAVATVSRIGKIIGLFCKRTLYERLHSAKETYNSIDPTDRSHPIYVHCMALVVQQIECGDAAPFHQKYVDIRAF